VRGWESIEFFIRNQQAVGSIPIVGSMKKFSLTVYYNIVGLSWFEAESGCFSSENVYVFS